MPEKGRKRKVFLSYAYNDREKVDFLKEELIKNGFQIQSDATISLATSWHDVISYELNASDFLVICLTKRLFSDGSFTFAYDEAFLADARKRDITIIPVLFENLPIPNELKEFSYIDLRSNRLDEIKSLIQKMKAMDSISFDIFTSKKFEELTFELLKTFNFVNIKKESPGFDKGTDFMANLYDKDPFGRINKETWFIEAKFYKQERFSVNILKDLVTRYKYIFREDAKLLLITNSLLTSVAREYLSELHRLNLIDIRVIDGNELKGIITDNKALHSKYFADEEPS